MQSNSYSFRVTDKEAHQTLLERASAAGISKNDYGKQILTAHALQDDPHDALQHRLQQLEELINLKGDDLLEARRDLTNKAKEILSRLDKQQNTEASPVQSENTITRKDLRAVLRVILKLNPKLTDDQAEEWAHATVPELRRRPKPDT